MLSETGLELGESYKVLYSFAIISCRMNNLMTSDVKLRERTDRTHEVNGL